ncbi:MAG: oligosaccharide flippase family protein [Clostridium sp.]
MHILFLGADKTAPLLFVLAFIFPFCGVTSTINGYFYGKNNARIPAVTQIIEQLVRVVFVVSSAFTTCFRFRLLFCP